MQPQALAFAARLSSVRKEYELIFYVVARDGRIEAPKPLCDSHIIPAFVGKWLKETSAIGFLRSATSPNLRQQDLLTKRLLCADCEGRLSGFERLAAERLFLPYVENRGRVRFEYEEWLLKFAISLSWRCLAASDGSGLNANPQHVAAVEAATGEFAGYLLDQRAAPKPSQSPYAGEIGRAHV